jgi:hypothetical protein
MGRTACREPQCLYSRAIPLLHIWAVRPVQSLSTCTRVHFIFFMHNEYQVFPGGKERQGHDADPLPPSSAVVMKE